MVIVKWGKCPVGSNLAKLSEMVDFQKDAKTGDFPPRILLLTYSAVLSKFKNSSDLTTFRKSIPVDSLWDGSSSDSFNQSPVKLSS